MASRSHDDLVADGHAVRAVTRDEARRAVVEAAGAECVIGDPDRIGTLRYALDNVTVLLWLLGTASGDADRVRALHDTRLEFMLERTIDTTVRGVVYEAAGSVAADVLAGGEAVARRMCERNEIPLAIVRADPAVGTRVAGRGARRYRRAAGGAPDSRTSRFRRIRAVAPQMRLSPTT